MVLEEVAARSRLLVERAAVLDADRFGDRDLDVVDVATVPDRLEDPVPEPEDQQVPDGLLSEVVVDAVDLRLPEDLADLAVQPDRREQVVAERLLDDDPPPAALVPLVVEPDPAQLADDLGEGRRLGREVEEMVAVTRPAPCRSRRASLPDRRRPTDRRSRSADSGSVRRTTARPSRRPEGRGEYLSSDSRRSLRSDSSSYGRRPIATMQNSWGRRFVRQSWYSAGTTLRWARSPVAPNRTRIDGSGTRSRRRPSRSGLSSVFGAGLRFPSRAIRRSRIVRGASLAVARVGPGAARPGGAARRRAGPRPALGPRGRARAHAGASALRPACVRSSARPGCPLTPSSPHDHRTRSAAPPAPWPHTNRPGAIGTGSGARA